MKTIKLTKSELEYKIKKDTIKDTKQSDKFFKSAKISPDRRDMSKQISQKEQVAVSIMFLIQRYGKYIQEEEMAILKSNSTPSVKWKLCRKIRVRAKKLIKQEQKVLREAAILRKQQSKV